MGDKTSFWLEDWTGLGRLEGRFHRMYNLSRNKYAAIHEIGEWRGGEWTWRLKWRRELKGREELWWQELLQAEEVELDPGVDFRLIWASLAPSNVKAFVWRLMLNRVQTKTNLRRRHAIRDDQSLACAFCQHQDETSDHLFCSCAVSMETWRAVLRWFGVSTALPARVKALFVQFPVFGRGNSQKVALVTVWMATCWSLWLFRNCIIFDHGALDAGQVLDLIQVRTWHWIKAKQVNFRNSLYEWKMCPMACLESL
ncbi:uncharacterized protein LOC130744700 [Lotus japonicus]|uniref:uncharacterized protein LOC130744700 n=1 Tax=Lotus japonicus TaxID=34305 RepID=UPI00258FCAFC|nr:uncharacterized protein LOC130744700 [Lotus japonicus]